MIGFYGETNKAYHGLVVGCELGSAGGDDCGHDVLLAIGAACVVIALLSCLCLATAFAAVG